MAAASALGQGTFIYDQQSSDESVPGGSGGGIQAYQPMGQSFTPSLSSVGFVRFELADASPGNARGSTIYVNLRTNGITGPILASTEPVFLPDGFGDFNVIGYTNFIFTTPVDVTPGITYCFQPVVQSAEDYVIVDSRQSYAGGAAYYFGQASSGDLWFREGIVVPEPSSIALVVVGGLMASCLRRRG